MACKYYIGDKAFTEEELKQHLINGGLDAYVKEGAIDLSKIKKQNNGTTKTNEQESKNGTTGQEVRQRENAKTSQGSSGEIQRPKTAAQFVRAAADMDLTGQLEGQVMQAMIGIKMSRSVLYELLGSGGKANSEDSRDLRAGKRFVGKPISKEIENKGAFLNSKAGEAGDKFKTVDEIAHHIWENIGGLNDEKIDQGEIKKIVEDTILAFDSPSGIAEHIYDNFIDANADVDKILNDYMMSQLPEGVDPITGEWKPGYGQATEAIFAMTDAEIESFFKDEEAFFNSPEYTGIEKKVLSSDGNGGTPNTKSTESSGGGTGIAIKHTDVIKEVLGLPKYEPSPKIEEEIKTEADAEISKGTSVVDILKRWESGKFNVDTIQVESELVKRYIATMGAKDKMTDEDINNYKRAIDILEKTGRLFGKGLHSRISEIDKSDSLAEFLVDEMWASKVDILTDEQKAKVQEEFSKIKEANEKLQAKLDEYEKAQALKDANSTISKEQKSASRKRKVDDIKKERESIIDSIKKKLKDSRSQFNSTPVPYANELIAIAPDVAKLVKNYVEEGVVNLSEIVDGIYEMVKDSSSNIQKNDIVDIIAGKYAEKKKTRSEILGEVNSLKRQASLVSRLKDLEDGIEPKYEKERIKKNQKISELKKQIDENYLHQLAKAKANIISQISKLEDDLSSGNFSTSVAKEPLRLDKEAVVLKDELIRLKRERAIRLLKEEYNNRPTKEKLKDMTIEVLNVPRTIMSSMDFSAPLRQGLVASVAHPTLAGRAFIEMFKQAVSQKRFDRWFHDIRESDGWAVMEQSGLYVADPHDLSLSAKEEQFMNNLAEKIPFIGKLIKGSERAYVSYLNKMRVDLFEQGADVLNSMGITFENNPKEYEGLASVVNNMTGRGKLGKLLGVDLEDAAPVFNSLFFSPRLIASRLNLLNPAYYAKLPKYARKMALKDMAKFATFGVTLLSLLKLSFGCDDDCKNCEGCIQVETDPRSSDFGKIKIGDTRYDIWGGFQSYVRVAAQLLTAQSKSTQSGDINSLDGEGAFGRDRSDVLSTFTRNKLSPIPATVVDLFKRRDAVGNPVTLSSIAQNNLLPLIYNDVQEAVKEDGYKALFTVGIPSAFGVGVNTYTPREKKDKTIYQK